MSSVVPPVLFQLTGKAHKPSRSPADLRQGRPHRKTCSWQGTAATTKSPPREIGASTRNRRSTSPHYKAFWGGITWHRPDPSPTWAATRTGNLKSPTDTKAAQNPNKYWFILNKPWAMEMLFERIVCSVNRELLLLLLFIKYLYIFRCRAHRFQEASTHA